MQARQTTNVVLQALLAAIWRRKPKHRVLVHSDRSEVGRLATCPPVVECGMEFQSRATDELALLPQGSAVAEMLSDYVVMRNQARACE